MISRRRLAGYGFVSMFLANLSFASAPDTAPRPQARPSAMAQIEQAAGKAVETVAMVSPSARPVQETDSGSIASVGTGIRPPARAGIFVTRQEPADSTLDVTRQVTRIHFGAEMRPIARPAHPLDGFDVVLASANSAERGDTSYPKPRPAAFAKLFKKREGGFSRKGNTSCRS